MNFTKYISWFMQLNPARGRKLQLPEQSADFWFVLRFMQLNPARGRKLDQRPRHGAVNAGFMQLNPARGRKLAPGKSGRVEGVYHGLCSSTPRGDGNSKEPEAR